MEFAFHIEAKESCALDAGLCTYILIPRVVKTSPKVHKIKKVRLSEGESIAIR